MNLDVYAPAEAGPWPVVIVVHGVLQSSGTFNTLTNAIASEGAVVYNINVDHSRPATRAMELIACAVRYARSTAAEYGGNPAGITLVGNSAGANTGVVVGLAGDSFEGDCLETEGSALLDAFVGYEGAYHLATTLFPDPYDHLYLENEDPELWRAINPYFYIGQNPDLRIRLIHGDNKDTAWYDFPPTVSIEFHEALADAGYDAEVSVIEGSPHTGLTATHYDAFKVTVEQVIEVARSVSE